MSRTDRAKKLILDHVALIGGKIPNRKIAEESDLSISTIECMINKMRKRGEIPMIEAPSCVPVVGVMKEDPSIVVRFSSAAEASKQGFSKKDISLCINGKRNSHAGYVWRRDVVRHEDRDLIADVILRKGVSIDECAEKFETTPARICQIMGWQ